MKTPDEIKKGLEVCRLVQADECYGYHTDCPYKDDFFCITHICGDALALIEHLEAKVPKWISVEEREPEFPCICYDGVNLISIPKNIASLTLTSGEKVFVSDVFLEAFPDLLIEELEDYTHILYWMPLPEPPEVD